MIIFISEANWNNWIIKIVSQRIKLLPCALHAAEKQIMLNFYFNKGECKIA